MTKEELKKIWGKVPADYYEKGIITNFFQKIWHRRKWEAVKALIPRASRRILDIGCASGWLTARVTELLPRASVTGLDVSPKMISYAQNRHSQVSFVCADGHRLPFPDKYFDLIICTETLEHVVDPLGVLLEMRRSLSPKGKIIISMDTGSRLFNLVWFFWTKTTGRVWQGAHLHQFNPLILERMFKKTDLRILKKKIYFLRMAMVYRLGRA